MKSGQSAILAARSRLTAGLPDVGTDGVLHRSLIRNGEQPSRRQSAFKAPSLPYQSMVPTDTSEEFQGIDPDGAFETQREKHRKSRPSVWR